MNNKKILILEGGYNEEHEVSLKSSYEIQKTLNKINIQYKVLRVNKKNLEKNILKYKNYVFFNALHGPFWEDGQIQKILRKKNIRFTHSGVNSSKNCFDKYASKNILGNRILTPKSVLIKISKLNSNLLLSIKKKYKKFIIKPSKSGSSYGIKIIRNNNELNELIINLDHYKKYLSMHSEILIEEFISGKELTVSTIKFSKKIEALAVTEIKPRNEYFDYQAKYSKGFAKHILPANISKKNYEKCLKLAIKIHKLLGCGSITRTDFIFNPQKNKIYFLETNTQPGLTSLSLLPEQAIFKKISFEKIILGILRNTN